MRAAIISLFPELIEAGLATSILGRARQAGKLTATVIDLRAFGIGGYRRVDDTPYGGGPGMVLMPEPLCAAVDAAIARHDEPCRLIMPSPQGRRFDQPMAEELAAESRPLVILCGHYEGIDERVRQAYEFEEVSVGDYVLTGGELPALTMLDAAVRLIEGVLGDARSAAIDSFSEAAERGLKYPQYTRPAEFRGMRVPEVLMSGNHAEIARWREAEAGRATRNKRPDLSADAGS
ncbi:MAG: tRNA (guanosine(37)-N1)-methyltransferase TrmD [Leptospirillia bacterium]